MNISCLFGRHWPVAAFLPLRVGAEESHCADCGVAMAKRHMTDWRVMRTRPLGHRIAALLTVWAHSVRMRPHGHNLLDPPTA